MLRKPNIFWGIVLLFIGVFFLVESLGLVNLNLWRLIWPILLILLGIWVLLGYYYKGETLTDETVSIPLEDAQSAEIRFHHWAGRFTLGAGAEPKDLSSGNFRGGLDHITRREGDHLNVTLGVKDSGFPLVVFPWFWHGQHHLNWDLSLTDEIPLDLIFKIGASDNCLVLTDLKIENLRIETGASQTEIHLPDCMSFTKVLVKSGISAVNIFVPEDVSARIRISGGLLDARVDRNRFPKSGGYFQSPEYETATHKVDIRVEMGVGSVKIQ